MRQMKNAIRQTGPTSLTIAPRTTGVKVMPEEAPRKKEKTSDGTRREQKKSSSKSRSLRLDTVHVASSGLRLPVPMGAHLRGGAVGRRAADVREKHRDVRWTCHKFAPLRSPTAQRTSVATKHFSARRLLKSVGGRSFDYAYHRRRVNAQPYERQREPAERNPSREGQ